MKFLSLSAFLLLTLVQVTAQENPPIPIEVEVRNAQFLNFGKFTVGPGGGTVVISPQGNRTSTSDIYLLGNDFSYAIFDVYSNPGTLIQVQSYSDIFLTGPTTGEVRLEIKPSVDIYPGQTFITTGSPFEVFVGGTLHVPSGDAVQPGNYNATFNLTFIHQ
ncbi:DUF4402 domain-containing protein [Salinimicrobium sp. HB62]|uniref:DUF4402 domain-containing protein n=1 Tax=Salinimicrobium sp. HB62 TaxID=3077781 RepID=UPI002D77D02F|nr:DUF4402 domain-containing protein [Salinimicrobium sp. HB62]